LFFITAMSRVSGLPAIHAAIGINHSYRDIGELAIHVVVISASGLCGPATLLLGITSIVGGAP
jgi:hypothetical protein